MDPAQNRLIERSLLLVKHDGVSRGLIGEILHRFERMGLRIAGIKMMHADEQLANKHYHVTTEWATSLFQRTQEAYKKSGKPFVFTDPMKYAGMIQAWNQAFLREGPVVAFVIEGPHAVELGRKMVGHTEPRQALPGTIRGDFMLDSYGLGELKQRTIRNLVHASGTVAEAQREIELWFTPEELYTYQRSDDHHFF